MSWDELLAFSLFLAALLAIGWRAFRALTGSFGTGCGSSCGSCSAGATRGGNLLRIEPAASFHDAKR